ncbi:MAG: four helix bundle protein [Deltaproteobacteria bacterium]|nr:four helix bundle protein [Deltaproteobacteria bacterium]
MGNEKKPNIIKEKTYQFALDVIGLYKAMLEQNEYIISKQIVRSGTSIGANVEEAIAAQSRKDFISKMSIASKEARETNYWLRLLRGSNLCNDLDLSVLLMNSEEIIKILTSIVKTTQDNR